MITAGIDIGAKTTKVVLLRNNEIISKSLVLSGIDTKAAVEQALNDALKAANISKENIAHITATGTGRKNAPFANDEVTEVGAAARGAVFMFPSVRTVIDVGAEEGRGVKCTPEGKVVDFVINEKCAAGAGTFTEAMARALEVKVEELGPLSLKSTQTIPMNAQCAVFAESEVVSLVHAKTSKEDIARAVHEAIASRIIAMVRRIGVEKDVALIGGLSKNVGFVDSMKRGLQIDMIIPKEPEFVGALGAALVAMDNVKR